ncbi:uncharacterized protein LOC128225544 [Mya arenaria]|uniref:uncharacterized protein LOC128225544 n=1 Tax=Mya arenaria TaxID=6604 RepID=UPI0022E58E5F|nr:uncharacterized protein LOC128225544 [Mya arenaria]
MVLPVDAFKFSSRGAICCGRAILIGLGLTSIYIGLLLNNTYYKNKSGPLLTPKEPVNTSFPLVGDSGQSFVDGLQVKERKPKSTCKEYFLPTVEENVNVIEQYPAGDALRYMSRIGGHMEAPRELRKIPVIVTAVDRNFYPIGIGLHWSVHWHLMKRPEYKNIKVIVYDLGLTRRQRKMMIRNCRCELRKFVYEDYPAHVKIRKTYAFKPIIIQTVLMEFGFVWWLDSSVRFISGDLEPTLSLARAHGALYNVHHDEHNVLGITRQTDARTFTFLKEDTCKFKPFAEVSATTVLFYFNSITKAVVKAWVKCALNEDCIAPKGSNLKIICDLKDSRDGRCHRFDQSVLGILFRRIYHETDIFEPGKSLNKVVEIRRNEVLHYFESCSPIGKCLI